MHNEIIERYQLDRKMIERDGIEYLVSCGDMIDFEQIVILLEAFFESSEARKQMAAYCRSTTNRASIKAAFEYTSLYNLDEEQDYLFEMYQLDEELKEHVFVYKLAKESKKLQGSAPMIMEKARILYGQVDDDSLKLKLDLIIQYELLISNQASGAKFYESMLLKLRQLKPNYVKTVLLTRLIHYYSRSLFIESNDWEEAEKNCLANIVNPLAPPVFKGSAHHIAGYIDALLHKGERGVKHLWRAVDFYQMTENFDVVNKLKTKGIPFCLNLNQQDYPKELCFENVTHAEQAHYYIVRDERSKAEHVLKELLANDETCFRSNLYWAYLKRDAAHLLQLACDYKRNAFELNLIKTFAKRM